MEVSREEKIILSILGEQVELEPPQSRIEVLLYELKDAIEQSGGGGGSGGGSVEPFFFVSEMKGLDPQSGEPIIEETSTTYNDVISKINSGCPIYAHMIVPLEYQSMTMGLVDGISPLMAVTHYYDPDSNTHEYGVGFAQMQFHATSPTDVLSMNESGGNNPT